VSETGVFETYGGNINGIALSYNTPFVEGGQIVTEVVSPGWSIVDVVDLSPGCKVVFRLETGTYLDFVFTTKFTLNGVECEGNVVRHNNPTP
jgi:hypothetical protein